MRTGSIAAAVGCLLAALVAFAGNDAQAQQQQNVNVRGTLVAVEGKQLAVKTRDGRDLRIDLPDDVNVSITKPFTLAEATPCRVLGVTTMRRPDGALVAIDVRPIPPAARQGLSPHDLQPGSTMTNAVMEGVVQSTEGPELTLNYQSGTVKVLVPPGTPMSQAAPGSRADLVSGEAIYVAARPEGDKLTAIRVQVGKDGVKPTQ